MTLHLGFDVHVMQASWYADAGAVRSHMICGISDTIKLDSNFSCGIEVVDIACAQSRARRDITLPTKVRIVKAMIFLVVMCDCERWSIRKAEHQRINAFELWCWRRLSAVPWTARRSNQSILREINPEYPLEGLMLKLKLQNFGHVL